MSDFLNNYRNSLLNRLSDTSMLNASVPPITPITQYTNYNPPQNALGVANQRQLLIGGGMLGYATPISDGMFNARVGLDKAWINCNNPNNNVDFRINNKGEASVNWDGRF